MSDGPAALSFHFDSVDSGPGVNYEPPIVSDFDNDGMLDIVFGDRIFLNDGAGGLKPGVQIGTKGGKRAADFNGDHNLDLVVNHCTTTGMSVYFGDGKGGFAAPIDTSTGTGTGSGTTGCPGAFVASDFNGDGIPDLGFSDFSAAKVGVMRGTGDGTFAPAVYSAATDTSPYSASAVAGGWNGDKKNRTSPSFTRPSRSIAATVRENSAPPA